MRWFALLRAINTGNRRLTNDELLIPFRTLGLTDVAAYQAAGNITFTTDRGVDDPVSLEAQLGEALAASYGFDTPVFLRSSGDLDRIVDHPPFTASDLEPTEGRVQVTLLRDPIDDRVRADALALVPDDDMVRFGDRHWYWLPRAGVGESSLPVGRFESLLGPMTMRTLGTLERMRRKFPD